MKKKLEIWIVAKQGIVKFFILNTITFVFLFGGFFINYKYLGNSLLLKWFIIACVILLVTGIISKEVEKLTPEEAYKRLKERLEKYSDDDINEIIKLRKKN